MTTHAILEPVGRLDAGHLLGFLGAHAVPGVETWDGGTYARSLQLPGEPAVVELRATDGGAMRMTTHGASADDAALVAAVRHLTAVDDDSSPAENALAADPLLASLVRSRPGLRMPGSVDPTETLVCTVIGQQVSVAGARATAARVVAMAGSLLPQHLQDAVPGVTHAFPTAAALAALDPEQLRMPRARGRSVVAVGEALAAANLIEDDDALLALPGIGPWTVAYTRMRTRRDPDVFLPTDLAVRRQLEAMGGAGDPPAARAISQRWAPYRSTALLHLWADYLATRRAA